MRLLLNNQEGRVINMDGELLNIKNGVIDCLANSLHEVKVENDKLRAENERIRKTLVDNARTNDKRVEMIKQLKADNDELRADNKRLYQEHKECRSKVVDTIG